MGRQKGRQKALEDGPAGMEASRRSAPESAPECVQCALTVRHRCTLRVHSLVSLLHYSCIEAIVCSGLAQLHSQNQKKNREGRRLGKKKQQHFPRSWPRYIVIHLSLSFPRLQHQVHHHLYHQAHPFSPGSEIQSKTISKKKQIE